LKLDNISNLRPVKILENSFSEPWKSVEKGVFSGGHLGIKKGGSLEFETAITLQLLVRSLQMRA
jgi:hypothetical protein